VTYQCENPACDLLREVVSEKLAQRRNLRCESCGAGLNLVAHADGGALTVAAGQTNLHDIAERLPSVLAVPLAEFLDETAPVLQLWDICNIAELSLRMLVLIGIAEHGKKLPDSLARELADRIERPTLGSWLGMAQAVAKHLPSNPLIPELKESVEKFAKILGNQASPPESGCLSLRNLLAHGGGMRRRTAEQYLSKWEPRIAEIVEYLSWMMDCQIAGQDRQGQLRVLKGPHPQGEIAGEEMAGKFPDGSTDSLWLVRSDRTLVLWPLGRYATPGMAEQETEEECVAQIYSRRGEVRLQYLNCGGDGAVSDSDLSALDSYLALFKVEAPPSNVSEYSVHGFESEFRKEASRRIGREHELAMLRTAVNEMRGGLVWFGGVAGMGKSCLIASLTEELLETPPKGTLVLAYRFRASDDRCSRETFVRFAIERIETWDGLTPRKNELPETTKPLARLKECLARVTDDRRVMFIVDGLDEISERDRQFVQDVILTVAAERVGCICVGRPDYGIPETLRKADATEPFPNGLPPMSQEDVRAMLVARTEGPLRKRLIKRDKESGDKIINPFIDRVTRLSEGLPLYVNHVVGDVLEGRIAPEAEGQLPAGLHAYHEELLRRCAIGDLHAVVTPLVATLAVAYEPLTVEELASLLMRRGVMKDPDIPLIGRGLVALASMIRRASKADGAEGYALFHASLREHILQNEGLRHTVGTTRTTLADAALKPAGDAADKYLYRAGIRHLLDEEKREDSLRLLIDFDYVMARLQRLGGGTDAVAGYYRDWDAVRTAVPIIANAEVWWDFLSLNRHLLMRGDKTWGAHKILLQMAVEHADNSPLTMAAETFLAAGKCDWLWFRNLRRPKNYTQSHCLAVLYGHQQAIRGARELSDGRIASWSVDAVPRVWDSKTGACVMALMGHSWIVGGVLELTDGRLLSWSFDQTLRVWDRYSGECILVLIGHTSFVNNALELSDGRILSQSSDNTLRLWDKDNGKCLSTLPKNSSSKSGMIEMKCGRILTWSDDQTLRIWDKQGQACVFVLHGHSERVLGALELSTGSILSWANDKDLRLWNKNNGECLSVLKGHTHSASGAREVSEHRIISWSEKETTLYYWDTKDGVCISVLPGHSAGITGSLITSSGHVLTWSSDKTLRLWEEPRRPDMNVCQRESLVTRGAIEVLGDRLMSWTYDRDLRLWDETKGVLISTPQGHIDVVQGLLALSDGRALSWSSDKTMRLWDTAGNCHQIFHGHTDRVDGAVELDDGHILSWSSDKTLRIWDIVSGKCSNVFLGHSASVLGAKEINRERIVSWACDGTIRLWNKTNGESLFTLQSDCGGVSELSDHVILSYGKELRLWNSDNGNSLGGLRSPDTDIIGAFELPDGRILFWVKVKSKFLFRYWNRATRETSPCCSIQELRNNAPDAWWRFVTSDSKGVYCGDWVLIPPAFYHRTRSKVICPFAAKLGDFQPHVLNKSGLLVLSSDASLGFFRLMNGSRPVTLEEASRLVQCPTDGGASANEC